MWCSSPLTPTKAKTKQWKPAETKRVKKKTFQHASKLHAWQIVSPPLQSPPRNPPPPPPPPFLCNELHSLIKISFVSPITNYSASDWCNGRFGITILRDSPSFLGQCSPSPIIASPLSCSVNYKSNQFNSLNTELLKTDLDLQSNTIKLLINQLSLWIFRKLVNGGIISR